MPALATYQGTKFGIASVVRLAAAGGATLGGVWISTKGTTNKIAVYDAASTSKASAGALVVASTTSLAKGFANLLGLELGRGLVVWTASCTGTIFWRPGQAGGV